MFLHTERLNLISENDDAKKAGYAILGVPFDSTETNIPGQRMAPNAIRESFLSKETKILSSKLYDLGNLTVVHGNAAETLNRIEETLKDLFMQNPLIIPVLLGGEHTITYAPVQILKEKYNDMQVVALDAHLDLKNEYLGEKFSHTTVMRRIMNLGTHLTIIGARTGDEEEKEIAKQVNTKLEGLDKNKPTYFSLDLDVFDPKYAPGISDMEARGLTAKEGLKLIKKIKKFNLVGMDIVEANPLIEKEITSNLAARCLIELLK